MGLSFLKRIKKNKKDHASHHQFVLQSDHHDDPATTTGGGGDQASTAENSHTDFTISRYAVLEPASSFANTANSYNGNGNGNGGYGRVTPPTKSSRSRSRRDGNNSNSRDNVSKGSMRSKGNSSNGTPTTAAQTPSPVNTFVSPTPISQKETPIHSNNNNYIGALELEMNSDWFGCSIQDQTSINQSHSMNSINASAASSSRYTTGSKYTTGSSSRYTKDGIENSSLPRPRSSLEQLQQQQRQLDKEEEEEALFVVDNNNKKSKKKKKKKSKSTKKSKKKKDSIAMENNASGSKMNNKKGSSSTTMRMTSLFLQPSKRDTAPMINTPITPERKTTTTSSNTKSQSHTHHHQQEQEDEEVNMTQETMEMTMDTTTTIDNDTHYQSHVLDDFYDQDSTHAGVELELSLADGKAGGKNGKKTGRSPGRGSSARGKTSHNYNGSGENENDGSVATSRKSDYASRRLENMFHSTAANQEGDEDVDWNATENASTEKMATGGAQEESQRGKNEETTTPQRNKKGNDHSNLGLGYLSANEKKFLSRLRRTTSKKQASPTKHHGHREEEEENNDMTATKANAIAEATAPTTPPCASALPNVPSNIMHDEDASMPSMLTEPEMLLMRKRSQKYYNSDKTGIGARVSTPPKGLFPDNGAARAEESGGKKGHGHGNNHGGYIRSGRFGNSQDYSGTYARSLTDGGRHPSASAEEEEECGESRTMNESRTFFGGTTAGFTTIASTAMSMSSASREGGIDKFLNMFQCINEDTAIVEEVSKLLTCEGHGQPMVLCGSGGKKFEKDDVDLTLEEEEMFTLDFQRDIIKNGMKLIYHESPSRLSTNPDWIQSTVKLFLRPGNCHATALKQPKLAWAVLPVVSRMHVIGSFDDDEEKDWSMLGLLDVHSILIDEGSGGGGDGGSNFDGNGTVGTNSRLGIDSQGDHSQSAAEAMGNNAATSTGFFSITTNTGSVYVFEAPSGRDRDYVVKGLRAVVARLTYRMIAGEADVIGELYNEDAGVESSGELSNLVTPWKALGRVTHDFLDQQ